jgi:hypothetical protein
MNMSQRCSMRKFSGTMPQRPKRKLAFCPNSHSRNARGHLTSSKICVNLREKCSAPLAKATFFLEPSLSRVTSTYHKSLSYAKLHKKCHVPEVSPMFCAILKMKKCTRMSPGTTKMKICRENDPPQRPRLGLVMFCQSHCNRESHQQHTTKKKQNHFIPKCAPKVRRQQKFFLRFPRPCGIGDFRNIPQAEPLPENSQLKYRKTRLRPTFSANLRNRNLPGHRKKIVYEFYVNFVSQNTADVEGTLARRNLREHVQSKCTWTCHKNQLVASR